MRAAVATLVLVIAGCRSVGPQAPIEHATPTEPAVGDEVLARPERVLDAEASRRSPAILAEIAALGPDHPWAGRYSDAKDLSLTGTTILVAPVSGCLMIEWGCSGITGVNFGPVFPDGNHLRVAFGREVDDPDARDHAGTEYTIEASGSERCLIEARIRGLDKRYCLIRRDESLQRDEQREPR